MEGNTNTISLKIVSPTGAENSLYSDNLPSFFLAVQSRPYSLEFNSQEVEHVRIGVSFDNKKNQPEIIPARATKRKNCETNVQSEDELGLLPLIYPMKIPPFGQKVNFEFSGCTGGSIGKLQLYYKLVGSTEEQFYELAPVIIASKDGKSHHASFLKLLLYKTGTVPLTEADAIEYLEKSFTKYTGATRTLISHDHTREQLLDDLGASNGVVSKENFENFFKWEGKFMTFMQTVKRFLTYWNNGAILGWLSSSYCSKLLEAATPGTFILQISHRNPQFLAVDVHLSVTQLPEISSSHVCAIILEKISSESDLKEFVSNYPWLETIFPATPKKDIFGSPTNLQTTTFKDYYNQSKAIQIPTQFFVTTTTTSMWNIWIKFEEEDFVSYPVIPTITVSDLKKCVPNVVDIGKYKIFKEDNTALDSRLKLIDCLADTSSVIMKKML